MKPLLGCLAALPTPFKAGALDLEAYRALVLHLLAEGLDGLVPIGTTGEASTMSAAEQTLAVKTVVEAVAGKVPVVAGAGSNSTAGTIEAVARVREAGADGALIVTPYYNKPTQDGLVAHYRAVAQAHPGFPLVAYNVPGRTGVDLLPETCARLCELPELVGLKDATGNLVRAADVVERCGLERLALLSGDDFTIAPYLAMGGRGVISVSANVAPRQVRELVHAGLKGDLKRAAALQVELNALHRALFLEANPIPVKAALALQGRYGAELRLPLTPMSEGPKATLVEALEGLELL